jgi:hypothetical protein
MLKKDVSSLKFNLEAITEKYSNLKSTSQLRDQDIERYQQQYNSMHDKYLRLQRDHEVQQNSIQSEREEMQSAFEELKIE